MTNVDESRPGLLHHLWKSALISGLLAVVLGVLILIEALIAFAGSLPKPPAEERRLATA